MAGINDNVGELLKAPAGFASLSRRISNKPIIAAVNGQCMGGGTEVVVNCDLVIASEKAKFGLPEPSVGVVAAAGAIPRLVRIAGHQVWLPFFISMPTTESIYLLPLLFSVQPNCCLPEIIFPQKKREIGLGCTLSQTAIAMGELVS